ncbi:GNAT family N-acetyltransferase [Shewanella yunxiaonensis]|uniref:GNAT family N-acetyltransferase n=1 Tax=Shewanella yunxiaonensis TaxID=2829809 RepID=A0ABX7YVJ7_9GAMM|nr:GNAT family N-acetyltransferase [Shewanella yunxiaonensis]QUN06171.1 GNAT family N-acetyltransferase [Shewanella yunxiaonensis]
MYWQRYSFADLDTNTLYTVLKLRVDVFVVEQQCPYPELDDKDRHQGALHLIGYDNGELVAYARLLPPGCSYDECSIGRVLVAPCARGRGLAHALMQQAIEACRQQWTQSAIRIGAQDYLRQFYAALGFQAVSAVYLEDGIPHLEMLLPNAT